jgi:probable rRNA maturation factor
MPTRSTRKRTRKPARPRRAAAVAVQRATRARAVPASAQLAHWARAAARGAGEITLRVVGAAEGRRLNRDYRGRDYATNVLSFAYQTAPQHGDVVLCHPVIAREARAQAKTIAAHYAHLVVHGMLHLRGYDHLRAADARRMERAEIRVLRSLGYANPYLSPLGR